MSDSGLLEAALEGLYLQQQRIESQITEVKALLAEKRSVNGQGSRASASEPVAFAKGKRHLSEAARKRIAAAQKKRWAEYRKSARTANKSDVA